MLSINNKLNNTNYHFKMEAGVQTKKDKFISEYLENKDYHKHSDIECYVTFTITSLLNYQFLFSECENSPLDKMFSDNLSSLDEINKLKREEWVKFIEEKVKSNKTDINNQS